MTWQELVSYLTEPRGGTLQRRRPSPNNTGGSDGDDSGSLSTSCSFEETNTPKSLNRFSVFGEEEEGTPKSHRYSVFEEASSKSRFWPSAESLEVKPSPSHHAPGLTRSGSIRVCESPLHRGSVLGSPAFRRKKMRTRR